MCPIIIHSCLIIKVLIIGPLGRFYVKIRVWANENVVFASHSHTSYVHSPNSTKQLKQFHEKMSQENLNLHCKNLKHLHLFLNALLFFPCLLELTPFKLDKYFQKNAFSTV